MLFNSLTVYARNGLKKLMDWELWLKNEYSPFDAKKNLHSNASFYQYAFYDAWVSSTLLCAIECEENSTAENRLLRGRCRGETFHFIDLEDLETRDQVIMQDE